MNLNYKLFFIIYLISLLFFINKYKFIKKRLKKNRQDLLNINNNFNIRNKKLNYFWNSILLNSEKYLLNNNIFTKINYNKFTIHTMSGRWAMISTLGHCPFKNYTPCLLINDLIIYANKKKIKPIRLPLNKVCFKVGRLNINRFNNANPNVYPCLAIKTYDNPAGRPFRVIDGKHRIHKLVADHIKKFKSNDISNYENSIWCSFIVLSIKDIFESSTLILIPNNIITQNNRNGTIKNLKQQMDSGNTNCALWILNNAKVLGINI